jgi:hypothetical protein
MKNVLVAIGIFSAIIAVLIISYEAPSRSKNKLTGRGGDFES